MCCVLVTVSLWIVRQKEPGGGRGGNPVLRVIPKRFHPGPVPSSHVECCLARPVVIVFTNVGPAYLLALHLFERTSPTTEVRQSVEVEDVYTRDRGSEAPGSRVEAAPLVVQDIAKQQVGRRIHCLVTYGPGVEGHTWCGHVCTWTGTCITGLCQW